MNELQTLLDAIKSLTDVDDEILNDELMNTIIDSIEQQFSPEITTQSINQIITNLEDQNLTKAEAVNAVKSLIETMQEMIYSETQYEGNKKILVDTVIDKLFSIFNKALEKYHSYSIELPMTIDSTINAKIPSYAHDTDAAADLYATEQQIVPAHSYGNLIHTGVKIQLPEGWLAMILPRSSMGLKTPLRLSNSIGLIDSGYRGELGVIYDNTSNNDYTIEAGDRIAQLLVMPSYRFKANVVDALIESDRGESGFGASGK